jgi:2-oxoglutarate dehydrogenase E1 component
MSSAMKDFQDSSHLFGSNAPFVEDLYEQYLQDPASVPDAWRAQFDQWQGSGNKDVAHGPVIAAFERRAKEPASAAAAPAAGDGKDLKVLQFIRAHRVMGSHNSQLDPLKRMERDPVPELEFAYYGFTDADLQREFSPGSWQGSQAIASGKQPPMKFADIVSAVKKTYCGTIGLEYMYISSNEQKRWIQRRFEGSLSTPSFGADQKRLILERITAAETLERYLHTRYVGQKRFSGEGGESLIPALDTVIEDAGAKGTKEVVIGMAHRGRLNVLVNSLGKVPADLFSEFEGKHAHTKDSSGDVKYHQG